MSKSECENLKKKWNIPLENKVLVSVGRLAKEKNLEETLNYFARLIYEEEKQNLTLLIVGDGPDRERLEKIGELVLDRKSNFYRYGKSTGRGNLLSVRRRFCMCL